MTRQQQTSGASAHSSAPAPTHSPSADSHPPSLDSEGRAPHVGSSSQNRFHPYARPSATPSQSRESFSSTSSSERSGSLPYTSSSAGSSTSSLNEPSASCPGVLIDWTPGSVWLTYPFHQHNYRDLSWDLVGPGSARDKDQIRLRSVDCTGGKVSTGGDVCQQCQYLPHSNEYKRFVLGATGAAKKHTRWGFLNHVQTEALLSHYSDACKKARDSVSTNEWLHAMNNVVIFHR